MSKLKLLSLFSGIGSFEKALNNKNIIYELVGFSEIDKCAVESYCAILNESCDKNLGDVSTVDYSNVSDIDLIVGGSPCQDFSVAGQQEGSIWTCLDCGETYNPIYQHYTKRNVCIKCNSSNLEKTRSSLLIEYLRAIREKSPKILIYENVKNIVGKKFKETFDLFNTELNDYHYNTYYKVMNLKNYGLPQNRERCFLIGIRNDIDDGKFEFPEPYDTGLRLKDFLESNVNEKYYISKDKTDKLITNLKEKQLKNQTQVLINHGDLQIKDDNICSCLDANYWKGLDNHAQRTGIVISIVGLIDDQGRTKKQLTIKQECPTLRAECHGNEPKILEDFYANCEIRVFEETQYRIRKLTPRECFRLQGFSDYDFDKAKQALNDKFHKGNDRSDSSLYRMAGNSIGITNIEALYEMLQPYFDKIIETMQ